jgi:hypothetical protein
MRMRTRILSYVAVLALCFSVTGGGFISPGAGVILPSTLLTVALLHCDGADGSTTFTDESGKTWTPVGNAQIDTAQSQFGGSAALFDGTGDYLSTPDSVDFTFGTGDFTIEMWFRVPAIQSKKLITKRGASAQDWLIFDLGGDAILRWYAAFVVNDGWVLAANQFGTYSINTWHHAALVRSGNTWTPYLDGVAGIGVVTNAGALSDSPDALLLGGDVSLNWMIGWIDEVRISRTARYTSNFTPPSAAFVMD